MSSIITINSANNFSQNYDDYIQNCHWVGTDILFGLMFEYIKPGEKLIDIGIGTGLSSKLFKEFGLIIYGVDGAEQMIKICQNKRIAYELKQIDLSENKRWFDDITFNHAVSHGVFHLIGDLKAVFNETSRLLSKNGCFGFTYEGVSNHEENYKESCISGVFQKTNTASDIKVYKHTNNYISDLLKSYGFQLLKKTEFLAFVDSKTNMKTYFNAIVARKQ